MHRWYSKQHEASADFFHLQKTEPADTSGMLKTEGQTFQRESQFLYGPASSRLLQLGSASQVTHSMLLAGASTDHNASGHLRDIAGKVACETISKIV